MARRAAQFTSIRFPVVGALRYGYCRGQKHIFDPTGIFMWQPQSIRSHLAAVFLLFFALVVILGSFSIWRLSNFDLLSADVAEVWLPTTRALGDLNNYTSDFRAFEGGELLSSDSSEAAATEKQMEDLDRTIADSEREFEAIRHDAAENALYQQFKQHWTDYRAIVNQMLVCAAIARTRRCKYTAAPRARPITRPAIRSGN